MVGFTIGISLVRLPIVFQVLFGKKVKVFGFRQTQQYLFILY
jgi:hypothetical protein